MAKVAINSVWASNTTNKANMTSEEISRGIIFESAIESKYPNTILNQNSKALKELQEGGTLWIENKNYPQGSIVSLMVSAGLFITQRMFIKISDNDNASFPLSEKSVFKELGQNTIYNIKSVNDTDWQEIGGYIPSNLIGDYNANSKAYEYGENCYIWVNRATNAISLTKPNNPLPYLWKRVLLQSCKDDNTSTPSAETLRNDWLIQDGLEVGHAIIDTANRQDTLGYLVINQQNYDSVLSFNDYPRVKAMMDNLGATQANNEWSVFKRINDGSFKFNNDKRGYFMRLWANGSANIDENREFQSLQECGIPNVKGSINQIMTDHRPTWPTISGCLSSSKYTKTISYDTNAMDSILVYNINIDASLNNKIYKENHKDVTPYNFNINLLVKI